MPTLTPIHQRMGEYVLANPFRAATMRIDELAEAVQSSVATANRFARALGFDGYPAFREALVRGFEATLAPIERLRSAQELETEVRGGEVFDAVFAQALKNLETTHAQIDAANVEAVVDAILTARRVMILGAGGSAFVAGLMEHGLSICHDNVQSLAQFGGPTDAARRLASADTNDLVVAIAFPRYVADTIKLARLAASRGVPVLAITDGPESPLASIAAHRFYVKADRRFAPTSEAAILTVIEALIDAVAHRAQRSAKAAAEITESVLPWLWTPLSNEAAARPVNKPTRKS
jgi:DNA-binding MurR/RpiR family transcriptional regulator